MSLSTTELIRYGRHLNLPDFGLEGQEKLKAANVLVVGAGGLGAPLLQYLTAAGVGTIGVVDFDTVDETNLQRQVLFGVSDTGQPKATTAIAKLKDQNPHVTFIEHPVQLDSSNALDIIAGYDLVADGTDNFPTRYLVNDACVLSGKPYVYASIYQFEGQVSVFNHSVGEEIGPNYRDLFPEPPPPGLVPNCAEGGVLGVLPGIIGSIQASEVIKLIIGKGTPLAGRLFLFDALDFTTRTVKVRRDPANPLNGDHPTITELIDYEAFCGMTEQQPTSGEITVEELKSWMDSGKDFKLIDVRETHEYEAGNIAGRLVPLSELDQHLDQIPKEGTVVVHCKAGGRSARAIQHLQANHGYNNLLNLAGGMLDWQAKVDGSVVVI